MKIIPHKLLMNIKSIFSRINPRQKKRIPMLLLYAVNAYLMISYLMLLYYFKKPQAIVATPILLLMTMFAHYRFKQFIPNNKLRASNYFMVIFIIGVLFITLLAHIRLVKKTLIFGPNLLADIIMFIWGLLESCNRQPWT